jgi:hypothetical protein
MASTYVNDLRLNEMATGDGSGTWGTTTNTNLELIAEAFSYGTEAITTNADTHTTTIADGATDPGRSLYLKYTGTLDSACTITIGPNTVSKVWIIENGTSGSQDIILSQGSGANITIPAGDTKVVYSDGAGAGAAFFDAFASLSVVDLKVQDDLTVTGDIDVDGTTNLDVVDIDGALTQDGGAVFNETGADVDFRVESDTVDHALFVQGSDGNVGIGTSSPGTTLDVIGTLRSFVSGGTPIVYLSNGTTQHSIQNTSGAFTFFNDGTERMRIDSSGNVGIGCTPGYTFEVRTNDASVTPQQVIRQIGSGDAAIGFQIPSAANWYAGVDNSASDSFVIGRGLAVGTDVTMTLDASGNVGIGTSSPNIANFGKALTITDPAASDQIPAIELAFGSNTRGANIAVDNRASVKALAITAVASDLAMTFGTNNTERMRIDSSGNLALGTANTTQYGKFAIRGGITVTAGVTSLTGTSFSTSDASNSTFWINHASAVTNLVSDAPMAFFGPSGSGVAERMRISSNGNLLVGTTYDAFNARANIYGAGSGTSEITLNLWNGGGSGCIYERYVGSLGSAIGSITQSGASAVLYNTTSDQRLKENITDANDAGDKIDAIKVRQYDWKADGSHQDYGMIAQELMTVAPEAVSGDADSEEMMGVDYSKLVPMLVKEIQSLRTRITALEG